MKQKDYNYRGLFLADLHFGAQSLEQTEKEVEWLKIYLKEEIKKDGLFDFIIIGGDYFDHQMYENDPYIAYATRLMLHIVVSTRNVRIIYGTTSHDSYQYDLFKALITDGMELIGNEEYDFKVINSVTSEVLLPDMKVLYIPEEYIHDKEDFYKEYLNEENKYDFIFGHGMIYEAFEGRIKPPSKSNPQKLSAPVFSTAELEACCDGYVLFGHYHVNTELGNKTRYVGSLGRWKFGEEEEKGLYKITGNSIKFIENPTAVKYVTVRYKYDDEFYLKDNFEEEAGKILKVRMKRGIDRLKIVFQIPAGYKQTEALIQFFTERFKNEPCIKVEFSNGFKEVQKSVNKKNLDDILSPEYHILLDKNAPREEKYKKFLQLKKSVDISADKIREILEMED